MARKISELLSADQKALIAHTMGDVKNVKHYGATGDGVTDDTAAIQSAVDEVEADGGGTVYLPPGKYVVGYLTVVGNENDVTRIVGSGDDTIILINNFQSAQGGVGYSGGNIIFKDFKVEVTDGTSGQGGSSHGVFKNTANSAGIVFDGVNVDMLNIAATRTAPCFIVYHTFLVNTVGVMMGSRLIIRNCRWVSDSCHIWNPGASGSMMCSDSEFVFANGTGRTDMHVVYGTNSGASGRVWMHDCWLGTGYTYANPDKAGIEVSLIKIPSNMTEKRVELYGCHGFSRNEDLTSDVSCIDVEGGWVRMFGCFFQAEQPGVVPVSVKTTFGTATQSGSGNLRGLIEMYGVRTNKIAGAVASDSWVGFIEASCDIRNYRHGHFQVDTQAGDVTLTILSASGYPGVKLTFTHASGSNTLTISPTSGNIDGASTDTIAAGATHEYFSNGSEWVLV